MSEYPPGTPSWVDLGSPDMEASTRFYGSLFGWETLGPSPDPAAGGYVMFTLRGKSVAGLAPLMDAAPAWTTYVSVADVDATVAAVRDAGGIVLVEPMDVLDVGRSAAFRDPTGAVLSLWQPRAHKGAQLVNEPGAFCWSELITRDPEAAQSFYGKVFGWKGEAHEQPGGFSYTEWDNNGRTIGGMMQMDERWPADAAPLWMVYFAVDDCGATVARTQELGGKVHVPPTDIEAGRFAMLQDPVGAMFYVIQVKPEG